MATLRDIGSGSGGPPRTGGSAGHGHGNDADDDDDDEKDEGESWFAGGERR